MISYQWPYTEGKMHGSCHNYSNATAAQAGWFRELQKEMEKNMDYYESKPRLDITETNEYTHWTAWAHTIPEERTISIRPPEFIDYNLSVLHHEIVHNYFPGMESEDYVTQIARGPLFSNYIKDCFRYCRK